MADLERRCRTCGQVAAHRKGDRLLALQHGVYVCVESLKAQLTEAQGRIAELEGVITTYWEPELQACREAQENQRVSLETLQQQPTTLTKEGGGE